MDLAWFATGGLEQISHGLCLHYMYSTVAAGGQVIEGKANLRYK
jgi:hypothetical protein